MAELALTVREAARAIGVSESTIYWMCYMRQIPHRRIKARGCRGRGKILISRAELERWLAGEEAKAGGKTTAFVIPAKKGGEKNV